MSSQLVGSSTAEWIWTRTHLDSLKVKTQTTTEILHQYLLLLFRKVLDKIQKIDFHFIPPRLLHIGGLWEVTVKAGKRRLRHTLSSASFTYEGLDTAVIEVEAILTSRPLIPMEVTMIL